nr:YlmH/Sll1252 family protein [uncultured Faecalimonas sp.]
MQKEEELLRKRLLELSKIASYRNFITYTDFLNLNELNILHTLPKDVLYTPYRTFGGYASSERQIAAFLPDALCLRSEAEDLSYPMGIIHIMPRSRKFSEQLSHRDYLGALLSLGIERAKIGDIIVEEQGAFVFVSDKLLSYLCKELSQIRRTPVIACEEPFSEFSYSPKYEKITGTVASVRLDTLLSLAFASSRSRLSPLIEAGKVFVNGKLITSNGYTLKENDVISVRGHGKFIYREIISQTKKGRLLVEIHKLI